MSVMSTRVEQQDTTESSQCTVDADNLEFIAEIIAFQHESEMSQCICLMLECLCHASSQPLSYPALQNNSAFLSASIDLLQRLYSESNDTTTVDNESLVGVKRRIVQLNGNLLYKNKQNQDLFREKGGIPLLLQHTNIDEQNPYIVQFAILATRNLCEGNVDNQRVISDMKLEGLKDNAEWLAKFGIDAQLCGDKLVVKNPD